MNSVKAVKTGVPTRGKLDHIQASYAMMNGKMVRRFNGNVAGKFYRVNNNTVESATEDNLRNSKWERAGTDINSWFNSSFSVVHVEYQVVNIRYDSEV